MKLADGYSFGLKVPVLSLEAEAICTLAAPQLFYTGSCHVPGAQAYNASKCAECPDVMDNDDVLGHNLNPPHFKDRDDYLNPSELPPCLMGVLLPSLLGFEFLCSLFSFPMSFMMHRLV